MIDLLFDRSDARLGLGDGSLEVFQCQVQLGGVQLLGLRPELRAAILLDLAFQRHHQLLELGDERLLLGHHRLLVLACRAFDRGLEPGGLQRLVLRCKGRHHLGREVRKAAQIEGLRHGPFYPIPAGKPNKTTPGTTT